jgi:hypothetical protein
MMDSTNSCLLLCDRWRIVRGSTSRVNWSACASLRKSLQNFFDGTLRKLFLRLAGCKAENVSVCTSRASNVPA